MKDDSPLSHLFSLDASNWKTMHFKDPDLTIHCSGNFCFCLLKMGRNFVFGCVFVFHANSAATNNNRSELTHQIKVLSVVIRKKFKKVSSIEKNRFEIFV